MNADMAVVWVRLPNRKHRTSALRLSPARDADGNSGWLVWVDGSLRVLSAESVGRPRRNGAARIWRERLGGEYRAYVANTAALRPGLHRRQKNR